MYEGAENTLNSTRKIIATPQSPPWFKAVFNHLNDSVGVAKEGVHLFCNPTYAALFGYESPEELIGTNIFELVAPEERGRAEQRAGAPLAGEAMAGRDQRRIAAEAHPQLAAMAGRFA